jgi:acyl carrier protein
MSEAPAVQEQGRVSCSAQEDRSNGVAVDSTIRSELTDFIVTSYLFGDVARTPLDDDALVEDGIIDSTSVLELIEFLESHFGIEVTDAETVPENLGSISALTRFVMSKRGAHGSGPKAQKR